MITKFYTIDIQRNAKIKFKTKSFLCYSFTKAFKLKQNLCIQYSFNEYKSDFIQENQYHEWEMSAGFPASTTMLLSFEHLIEMLSIEQLNISTSGNEAWTFHAHALAAGVSSC